MRLIDADAFDARVRIAGGMSEEELTDDFKDGVLTTLELLKTQPSAQPEQQWIPATENTLPEAENMYQHPTKRYLCQREGGCVRQFFVGARLCDPRGYLKDWWDWYGVKIRDTEVVAYMPLPEPYKGGQDG